MDWQILFLGIIVLLFFILFLGEWIAFTLGITGLVGLALIGKAKAFSVIGMISWNMTNSFEMTAIPLFIFMGEIMIRSGLSQAFYHSAAAIFGRLPGGLLQTNIISCSVFAAISGSSPATAAAIGSVAYPEMVAKGYKPSMVIGSLCGGGALGILIPPSIIMIIYGSIASVSVERLFIAGVVPGLLAALIFMIYLGVHCLINPSLGPPKPEGKVPFAQKLRSVVGMFPFFFLIFVVLGGIYLGWTTPTEAAAIGAFMAMLMSLINRSLTRPSLWQSLVGAVRTSAMILTIIIGAQVLSYFVAMSGISRGLTTWIVSTDLTVPMFLLIITVMYIILGCIMDGNSMIYLTIPILLPIMEALRMDLVWFGIILTILIELAQITPPVGLNLYVLHGIAGKGLTFGEVITGSIPYCLMYLLMAFLVMVFPQIALWLPNLMP